MYESFFRMLVITEDEYLREIFEGAGYKNNFIVLRTEQIFGIKPDLIVLDLSNNTDLVNTVRKNFDVEGVPILAVINITQVANKKAMDFNAIKDIVVKPVTFEEISNKLELLRIHIDFLRFRRTKEGLYREELEQLLEIECKRYKRYGTPFSLMVIRIDDFERLTELKGPKNMNNLFKEILRMLKNMLRNSDFVARFSEKEFAILLTNTDSKGALETASRIQRRIRKHRFTGFSDMHITVSIGIAQMSDSIGSFRELIDAVKIALSRAIRNEKGKISLFDNWIDYPQTSN